MKSRKKLACAIVSAILSVSVMAGCGTKPIGNTTKSSGETTGTIDQEESARGRYMETEVVLPDVLKDALLISFIEGKNGQIEIIAGAMDGGIITDYLHYTFDGISWTEDVDWGGMASSELGISIKDIIYGADGFYYMGGRDYDDYDYHFYRSEDDGTFTELLEDVFKPTGEDTYGLSPDALAVNSRGEILISDFNEAYLYQADGTKLNTFVQDFTGNVDSRMMALTDEAYITTVNNELVRYSLESGVVVESDPLDVLNGIVFEGQMGEVYLANETGLLRKSRNGTIWETLIEGNLTSLGMKSLYLNHFMEGDRDEYYGVFTGQMDRGISLYHYTYDADVPTVPPTVLTVYALEDSATIRQAASVLQKKNPDIRVDFRVAMQDADQSVRGDIIRSLNTELSNGKGADVLILDGLPRESYEKKGVLWDIRELFENIHGKTPFLEVITQNFSHNGSPVYYMPARISFPVLYGEDDAVNAFESLEALNAYDGETPIFPSGFYESILRTTAKLYQGELFGDHMEQLSVEQLTMFLETVKKLAGAGAGDEIGHGNTIGKSAGTSSLPNSDIMFDDISYDKGETACSLVEFDSITDTTIPWAIVDKTPGNKFKTVNGVYFPRLMTGINQASGEKEAALQFLEVLYSEEVQSIEFIDGFPVLKKSLASWADMDREGYSMMLTGGDGYELFGEWPNREKRETVLNLTDTLTNAVTIDETMMEMIINGSKEYFEGSQTADQAAAAILQKINLYLAE